MGAVGVGIAGPGQAAELNACVDPDNRRPVVKAVTAEPKVVDVTERSQQVTVRARVTDAGGPGPASGVERVWFAYRMAGANHWELGPSAELTHESGDMWSANITVEPGMPAGTWTFGEVNAWDAAGNSFLIPQLDPPRPDTDVTIDVVSHTDTVRPVATWVDVVPTQVDTRERPQPVQVRLRASDEGSGIAMVRVELRGGGNALWTELTRTAEDLYETTARIPRWVGTARWKVDTIHLVDRAGNSVMLNGDEAAALGTSRFQVVSGKDDQAAPTASGVTVRPTRIDARRDRQRIVVTARIRDPKAGVDHAEAYVANQTMQLRRVKGTRYDGRYRGTVRVGPCSDLGTSRAVMVEMWDRRWPSNNGDQKFRPPLVLRGNDNLAPVLSGRSKLVEPEDTLWVRFSEAVDGIRARSVEIRRAEQGAGILGPPLEGRWSCTRLDGQRVPCIGGRVRIARLNPTEPLVGSRYRIQVNPEGVLDVTDPRGNPVRGDDSVMHVLVKRG